MPPKKKGDGMAKLADKDNLARAETEILSLQHLLELRSHEVGDIVAVRAACTTRRCAELW